MRTASAYDPYRERPEPYDDDDASDGRAHGVMPPAWITGRVDLISARVHGVEC
jgi:hypothetical protein